MLSKICWFYYNVFFHKNKESFQNGTFFRDLAQIAAYWFVYSDDNGFRYQVLGVREGVGADPCVCPKASQYPAGAHMGAPLRLKTTFLPCIGERAVTLLSLRDKPLIRPIRKANCPPSPRGRRLLHS